MRPDCRPHRLLSIFDKHFVCLTALRADGVDGAFRPYRNDFKTIVAVKPTDKRRIGIAQEAFRAGVCTRGKNISQSPLFVFIETGA
ncbi:MAG: hypothetical protein LBD95_00620 [Clostridiales Family XIII bacterium]|nr:hypothetical protein [Clostridiales Family XIII bacterium]